MNQKDGERWKSRVLNEIFVALAASEQLRRRATRWVGTPSR
jgi:hypothetical protein